MMGYGYENAAGDRISALIDMINGGGPGRSGGTFEGGGILSLLANAVAKPYGSVRERPGHTPMGATAAPMDVIRPIPTEPVDAAVLPGSADITIPPYTLALQGERSVPEATSGRTFTEEDFAVLGRVHPEVAKLFSGVRVGDPLSRQQAMFLNAARVGLDAPSAALTFPAPSDPTFDPTFFTQEVSAAPAAETAAPLVSLRPKPRPDAGITIPPYTLALQGQPIPPLVPPPTDIPTAPATAYESLGEPTLFTQDQLDAMSPAMKLMAEEHNRENARLVAEDDILKLTSAIEAAVAGNVPIRVIIRGKAYTALPSGTAVAEE